jgi:hypothetical protein
MPVFLNSGAETSNKKPPRPKARAECGVRSELKQRFQYHSIVVWTLENLPPFTYIHNKIMVAISIVASGNLRLVKEFF